MENVGSLGSFLECVTYAPISRPVTASKAVRNISSAPVVKKQSLADRLSIKTRDYDKRPTGAYYQTPTRATRASSALTRNRPVTRISTAPQTEKPIKSATPTRPLIPKPPEVSNKISLQEQVRNELLLKNKHFLIRSMKKIMRNDEKEAKTCEDKKNNFFNRLVQRFQNPEVELKDGEFKAPMATENLVQKYSVVKSKELNSVREPWMKKRACLGSNKDNELAKHIFKLCQHNGEIKSNNFVRLLVEIGVPLPCKIIIETLENLFNTKNLDNFIMGENAIIRICKSDTLSKRFMGKILEDVEKILKADSNDSNKREVSALDVEKLLKVWWQEADTYGRNQLHLNEISEFLLRKGIVADQTEGRKILNKIFKDLAYIDYNHFLLVFSKPLIKYSLSILWKKVLNESRESMYFSNDYSLTTLKKKILLAGINYPTTEFTVDEGIYAINAIEKYKEDVKSTSEKMTYEEFCKYWSLTTGQECGKNFLKGETKLEKKETVLSVFKKNDVESEISSDECEVKDKAPTFTKNERYTILGNFNISTLGAFKWRHSVSPNVAQFTVSTSDGESKIRNQQKVFTEFLKNSK